MKRRPPSRFATIVASCASVLQPGPSARWLALACALSAAAPAVRAEIAARPFDIAAGPADVTLAKFAAQAGVQFVFSADKVRHLRTQALKGRFTPQQALDVLLAGTGLKAVFDPRTATIMLDRVPPAAAAPSEKRPASTPETPADETVRLSEFSVVSTLAPRRRLDSAAAITTIDSGAIKNAAPRGAPELMKLIAGFYVESAGGEGRANVYPRGMPQSGGYTFTGLQEDGLGVLSETATRGVAPDVLTRLTGLVARVEAVRGGPAGVLMNNAPGGIIQFINREGGAAREGGITLQTGDNRQIKTSAWMSGPLTTRATFALSADFRRDNGQRYQGFTANDGGGVAGNLKLPLADERGYVKLSAKWHDERSAFYVPIPLRNARDPQTIPGGVDVRTGHIYSADLRRSIALDRTPDGPSRPDLADGSRARLRYVGSDVELPLAAGFKLKNLNRLSHVEWRSSVLLLSSIAMPLQALANNIAAAAGSPFAPALASGNYRYRLSFAGTGATIADPAALNGNGLGILQSAVIGRATIDDFQNDFRLMKTTDGGATLSAGCFAAWMRARQLQSAYTLATEIRDLPRRLDFEFLDAASGASLGYATEHGVRQVSPAGSYRNNRVSHRDYAPYLNVEQSWRDWTFGAAVRHETKQESVTTAVLRTYDLNEPGQNNPARRNATYGSGSFYTIDYDIGATVWTASANYRFGPHLSAYGLVMSAYRMSGTEDLLAQARGRSTDPGPTNRIVQFESGVKFSTRKLAVFASVIDSTLTNQLFPGNFAQADGSIVPQNYYRDTTSRSLELETFYTPFRPVTFHFVGTVQSAHFSSDAFVTDPDRTNGTAIVNIKGNRPVRIPRVFFNGSVYVRLPDRPWGQCTVTADWEFVGQRAGDEANRTSLAAYSQFALGASVRRGRITWRVRVQNVLDEIGFTERDPRTALLISDPNAPYLNARSIAPRSIAASVEYSF